jgi:5-methylcytosine-specific restriction protein A
MPARPPHRCASCHQLVTGPCPTCTRPAWTRSQPVPRIRGRKLQQMRARLFDAQPLCVVCLAKGCTTVATIRDHVVPLAEGGPDTQANAQPLCVRCSDTKTRAETQRGRQRTSGGL